MKLLPVFYLFLSILPSAVSAHSFEMNESCRKAYHDVFLLKFQSAEKLLQNEQLKNPDNAAVHYVGNYLDFMRAFISEEKKDFDWLKKNYDLRLKEIDKLDPANPWKGVAKGELQLHVAIIKFKRKEYLSAGIMLRRSFHQLETNHQRFPSFMPGLKSLGFLHGIIGAVPENFKWITNLAGMRGSIKSGMQELNRSLHLAAQPGEYDFLRDEIMFLTVFMMVHLEKNPAAAENLIESYKFTSGKMGALHVFLMANTKSGLGKYDEAKNYLSEFSSPAGSYPLFYLDYMRGNLLINMLDTTAAFYFHRYATQYHGTSFIKSAWHKLAWCSLLRNDQQAYWSNMKQVAAKGNDFTDEDKQAQQEALNSEMPNSILLRSRLLFDGGNYSGALAEIAGKPASDFPRLKDQIEFTYRLARIFDKKNQKEKSIQYYGVTYENGKNRVWYFAANSALLLGEIYESQKDYAKAREWFKKCLSLRNHEYQNSIDQKAEAGLNRVSNYVK